MSTHTTNYSAINLLFNGGFELVKDDEPALWDLQGFTNGSSAEILDSKLRVVLGSTAKAVIGQDFSEFSAPLDFPTPYGPGLQSTVAGGYRVAEARLLPKNVPYTIAFDAVRVSGTATIKVFYELPSGTKMYADNEETLGSITESRLHFTFQSSDDAISFVGIELQSNNSASIDIDRVMLAAGDYSELPYTGDPFQQVFPESCIVLSLGESCPTGFAPLEEGDLQPLSEWVENEPGVRAKKGNYPRSAEGLSGTVLHTAENALFEYIQQDVDSFEDFQGRLFTEFNNSFDIDPVPVVFTINSENPQVDLPQTHTHSLESAGTRPLSVGFTFCKRL